MKNLSRRRFIAISAAFAALPARAAPLYEWRGLALGAAASIHLAHPDAPAITARAVAEIDRLENIFSLYRADSALSHLNAAGTLTAPPFELLQCLSLCSQIHAATNGRFNPAVQPLWSLYAQRYSAGQTPSAQDIATATVLADWSAVRFDSTAITLRPGMALTLNGVAQGYVADRIADLLAGEGLTNILINTGELRALGGTPNGGGWPVTLALGGTVALSDRALASSATLGTTFDAAGNVGHILNPATGLPANDQRRQVSIAAPSAALADALSTAACLMTSRAELDAALRACPGVTVAGLVWS